MHTFAFGIWVSKSPDLVVTSFDGLLSNTVISYLQVSSLVLELHDTRGTHSTPRCQILSVPTILEIPHDGTTVDYYTTSANFRYIAAASTFLPASHCMLLPCKQTHMQPKYTAAE